MVVCLLRRFRRRHFKYIFRNENICILIRISLKFVPMGSTDIKWALIQVMAWRWTGDYPQPEPLLTQFADAHMSHTHISVILFSQYKCVLQEKMKLYRQLFYTFSYKIKSPEGVSALRNVLTNGSKSSLVRVIMAWCQIADRPLP